MSKDGFARVRNVPHLPKMQQAATSACVLVLTATGCGILTTADEVTRSASPDGRVEDVVAESNGGATTSFGMRSTWFPLAPASGVAVG